MHSKLKLYSLGIVAKDKDKDSLIIDVTPIEITPFYDGQLTPNDRVDTHSGVDADGKPYTSTVTLSTTIKAHWLPMGDTQRQTPPDVCVGEYVSIYRYADDKVFFWHSRGDCNQLRLREHVEYRFANKPKHDNVPLDDSNSYYLAVSTRDKLFRFKTNKNDGEVASYDIQLDTSGGTFYFKDDVGQEIMIDSLNHLIQIKNADDTFIQMDHEDMSLSADSSITLSTKTLNLNYQTANITGTTVNDHTTTVNMMGSKINVNNTGAFSGTVDFSSSITHQGISIGNKHTHIVVAIGKDTLKVTPT